MPYKTPTNKAKKDRNINLTGCNVITKFTVQTSPSKRFDRKSDGRVNMSGSGMRRTVSTATFKPAKKSSTLKNSIIVISDSEDEDWIAQTRGQRTASKSQVSTCQGQRTTSQGQTLTQPSSAQHNTGKTLNGSMKKSSNNNFLSPGDKRRSSTFTKPNNDFLKVPQKLDGATKSGTKNVGPVSTKKITFLTQCTVPKSSARSQSTQKMSSSVIFSTKTPVSRGKIAARRSFVSPPSPKRVMANHMKMLQKNRVTSQTSSDINKGVSRGLNKNLLKNQIETKSKNYPNVLPDFEAVIPPPYSKKTYYRTGGQFKSQEPPQSTSQNLLQRSKEFFAKKAEKRSSVISKDKNQNILIKPAKVTNSGFEKGKNDSNSIIFVDSVELRKVLNNKILGSGSTPLSGKLIDSSGKVEKMKHRKSTIPPVGYTDDIEKVEEESVNDLFQNSPSDDVTRSKMVDEVVVSSPEDIFFDCLSSPFQGQRSSTEKSQNLFPQDQSSLSRNQGQFSQDEGSQGQISFDQIVDDRSVSEHSLTNITDDQKRDLIMTRQSNNGEFDNDDMNSSEQVSEVESENKSTRSVKRRGAGERRENKRHLRGASSNSDRSRGSGKSNSSLSQGFMDKIIDDFINEANSKTSRIPPTSKVFTDASNRGKKIKHEKKVYDKNKKVKQQSEIRTLNLRSSTQNIPQENCSKIKSTNSGDFSQSQNRSGMTRKKELRKDLSKNFTSEKRRINEKREAGNFFQNFIGKSSRSSEVKSLSSNETEQGFSKTSNAGNLVEKDSRERSEASNITHSFSPKHLPSSPNFVPEKGRVNKNREAENLQNFFLKSEEMNETKSSLKTEQESQNNQDVGYFVNTDSRKRACASNIFESTPPKRLRSFIDIEQNNKKMRSIIDSFLDDAKKKSKEKRMEGGSPLSQKASFVSPPSQHRRIGLFQAVTDHPVTKMLKTYTMNSPRTPGQKLSEMVKNTQNLSPKLGLFVKPSSPSISPKTPTKHEMGKPQETKIKPPEKGTLLQSASQMVSKLNLPKSDLGSNVTDLALNARSKVNEQSVVIATRTDVEPDTNTMSGVVERSAIIATGSSEVEDVTMRRKQDGFNISQVNSAQSSTTASTIHHTHEIDHESHGIGDPKSSHEVNLRDYYIELSDDEDHDVIDLTQSDDEADQIHKSHESNHENRDHEKDNKTGLVHDSESTVIESTHENHETNHETAINKNTTREGVLNKNKENKIHNQEKHLEIAVTGSRTPDLIKTTQSHEENSHKIHELDHEMHHEISQIDVNSTTTMVDKNIMPSTPEDIFAHVSNALNDVLSSTEKQISSEDTEDDTITQITEALERAISQVESDAREEKINASKTNADVTTISHDSDSLRHGSSATITNNDINDTVDSSDVTVLTKYGAKVSKEGPNAIKEVPYVRKKRADAVVDDVGSSALKVGSDVIEIGITGMVSGVDESVMVAGAKKYVVPATENVTEDGADASGVGAHTTREDVDCPGCDEIIEGGSPEATESYTECMDEEADFSVLSNFKNSSTCLSNNEQIFDALDYEAEIHDEHSSNEVEKQRLNSNIMFNSFDNGQIKSKENGISVMEIQTSKSNILLDVENREEKQSRQVAGLKNEETDKIQDNPNSNNLIYDEEDLPFLNTPKRFSQGLNSDDDFTHERKVQSSMFDIDQFFDDMAAGDDDQINRHAEPEMNDDLPEIMYKDEVQSDEMATDAESDIENFDLLDELPDITETPRSKKRRLMEKSSPLNSLDKSEKMMSQLLNYSIRSNTESIQESPLDGTQLIKELDELSRAAPRSPRNPRKRVRSSEAVSTLGYQPSYSAILIDTNFSRCYKKHGPCIKKLVKEKQRDYEVDKMEEILLSELKKGGFRGTLERAENSDGEGSSAECDEDTKKAIDLMKEDWGTLPQLSSNSKIFKGGKLEFCQHNMELRSCFTPSVLNSLESSKRKVVSSMKASTLKQHKGFLPHLLNNKDTSTQTHRWLLQVLQCYPESDMLQRIIQSNLGKNNCNQSAFNHSSFKSAVTGAGIEPSLFGSQSLQKIIREECRPSICQSCLKKNVKKKPRNVFNIVKVFGAVFHIAPDILNQFQKVEFAAFLLLLLQDEKFIQWSAEIVEMLSLFLKDMKEWNSMKFLIVRRLLKCCSELNIIQELCSRIHFNVGRLHELSRIISFAILRLNVFVVEVKTVEMDNFNDIDALIDVVDHLNPENLELLLPEESADESIGSQKRSYYHLSLLLPLLNICIGDVCKDSNTMNTLERITSILRTMNKRIRDNGAIYRSQVKYELSLFTKNLRNLIQKAPKKNKASIFKYLRAAPVHEQVIDNSFENSSDESSGNEADVSYQDDDETDVKGQSSKFKKTPAFSDGFDIAEILKSRIIGSAGKG